MMLERLGGPQQAIQALDSLKSAGAITDSMATIYREALTSAGTDSAKFADTIVQRRQEMADTIARDLTSSPATALAVLDNVDAGMTAQQVESRSRMAYESLLQVSNNDMAALTASIDRAVETGQLNAQNATVIKDAAQRAGTDASRFAQLMSENKDSLAQIALLQAQQGANNPNGPSAAAGGNMSNIFGNMQDNPFMKMINQIIIAFTGGKMSLESLMQNAQNRDGQGGPRQQTPEGPGSTAGRTNPTTTGPATVAGTAGATQDQAASPVAATVAPEPASTDASAGPVTLASTDLNLGGYQGFDWMDNDLFGPRLNDPLSFDSTLGLSSPSLLTSPSIFRTSFRDDAGFNFGTTPRVDLLSGDMSINGMSPTSRFGMLSNPDPLRISVTDPRLDLTATSLSESFSRTPDQSADVTATSLRLGVGGAR